MRKTIYVKNQEVWDGIKSASESRGISISEYLLGGETKEIPTPDYGKGVIELLKEINDKIDRLFYMREEMLGKPKKTRVAPGKIVVGGDVLKEGETITDALEKIHTQEVSEKEPEKAVKELMTPVTVSRDELIAPLKEKIEKIQGKPIVGYSKDRQLGKKGNK